MCIIINMDKTIKTAAKLASEEYDSIAKGYQEATKREMRRFTMEPSLVKQLGNLEGKTVLDLACGEGYSSRLCRDLGAKEITGIDISKKEIEMAKEIEATLNKIPKIKYLVADATKDLVSLGKFDLVTAVMMLHYSTTKEDMLKMIKNIKNHLNENGIFLTTVPNPEINSNYDHYGVKLDFSSKDEGARLTTTLSDFANNKLCSFTNYYWKKETYQKALEDSGFQVEWLDFIVSPDGLKKYGADFWEDFKTQPVYAMLRAKLIK